MAQHSTSRPLEGARVALTRSAKAARDAVRLITELGGEPLILPLTLTVAITASVPGWPDIARVVDQLEHYQWLLFTSASGVVHFLDLVPRSALDERARDLRIACVGAATAKALAARGLRADVVPPSGGGHAVADAMCAASGQAMDGARVLFPRALEGRDEAVTRLRERGARVDIVPVYRTVSAASAGPLDERLERGLLALRRGRIHAVAFFAPSQVDALFELMGDAARDALRACALVAAIGDTTRAALTRRGVDVHVVPSRPGAEHLIHALASAWQTRGAAAPPADHETDSKDP